MENIRDWCISRQLWWGHRIPVWYGPDGQPFAARDDRHAAEQASPPRGPRARPPPDLARARSRRAAAREEERMRDLVLEMGRALGIRPPLPDPRDPLSGWGPRRLAPLYDTVLGLYAGLLHRWGAPLARRRGTAAGVDEIVLAGRGS